jgi:DNA adenine methylase
MISSPLRYPGGKAKLYPFFAELIKKNDLFESEYCEPYAGGAGLALRLLSNGFVRTISINDIDSAIFAFWVSALRNTDKFCALLEATPVTIDEWHKQKEILTKADTRNSLKLGFAAYFLNRTNRSGIIEGAGPIGGYEQAGRWKVDARLVKQK